MEAKVNLHVAHPKDLKKPGFKDESEIKKDRVNVKKMRSEIKSKRADHKVPKNSDIF